MGTGAAVVDTRKDEDSEDEEMVIEPDSGGTTAIMAGASRRPGRCMPFGKSPKVTR